MSLITTVVNYNLRVKAQVLLASLLFSCCVPLITSAQDRKDIFLSERGCPLVSTAPVTGSALVFKNAGKKPIARYTLACFRLDGEKRKVDLVFDESDYPIGPGESVGEGGFDTTPPNICRWRKRLIGVYEVKFGDGTSWKTTALR